MSVKLYDLLTTFRAKCRNLVLNRAKFPFILIKYFIKNLRIADFLNKNFSLTQEKLLIVYYNTFYRAIL